jgi:quercetin dioxygenase-like cupin family protein
MMNMNPANPRNSAIPIRSHEGKWHSTSSPGVFVKVLNSHKEIGESILLRFESGASFPGHNHPGGEEVYVIEGDITLGQHELSTGDYLYTPPDEKHAAKSKNGCLMFVRVAKPIEMMD